jgi:hypothetical protein
VTDHSVYAVLRVLVITAFLYTECPLNRTDCFEGYFEIGITKDISDLSYCGAM